MTTLIYNISVQIRERGISQVELKYETLTNVCNYFTKLKC